MNGYNNANTNNQDVANGAESEFIVTVGGLEPDSYSLRMTNVEPLENRFGKAFRWVFEVIDGEQEGRTTSRITSRSVGPQSNAFRLFIRPLLGRQIAPGEKFDVRVLIGAEGEGRVDRSVDGGSFLASFKPTPKRNGAGQAVQQSQANGAPNGYATQEPHI